jgi:hypothetical protein
MNWARQIRPCTLFEQQLAQPESHDPAFEQRLARLLKAAKLRVPGCVALSCGLLTTS